MERKKSLSRKAVVAIGNSNNMTITNNIISSTNGIDEQNTCNYNMYIGNNCRSCTTDFDINCAVYYPYPAANFYLVNIGTWT